MFKVDLIFEKNNNCAVLLLHLQNKCKLVGVKGQVPFIVCLCILEVVPVPLLGGVS